MVCSLCSDNNFKVIFKKDSKSKKALIVCVCNTCSMVSQNPIPTEQEVAQYYSTEYRQDYKQAYEPKLKHVYRAGNLALNRLRFLTNNNITSGKLLDIGAGGGEFTYISNKLGFVSTGIEPNIGYSNYAKNQYQANVKTGQLADIDDKFDVITAFHVIEHIPGSIKTFEKLYDLLNKKGYLLIEVPNIETYNQSPANTFFKAHIHYFSETTLISAASQFFSVVSLDNSSNLCILFEKRQSAQKLKLPAQSQVNQTKKILEKKGWFSYVIKGKGYKKAFNRLKVIIQDTCLIKASPKVILDTIIDSK